MIFLRCLYRRPIGREMIGLVARASLWLAHNAPGKSDPGTVGLALFRAGLQDEPGVVCAALGAYGVTVEELVQETDATAAIGQGAGEARAPGQADPASEVLYCREMSEGLNHWLDRAEVQARNRSDRMVLPEHVLLAILAAEGPWREILARRGLSAGAIRAGIEAELAVRPGRMPKQPWALPGSHSAAEWLDSPAVGVPRRFGVGGMLLIVTMFALLYGGLQWLEAPPVVFVTVAVFFAGLALGQMLFRGGRAPRAASVKIGAVLWPAEVFALALYLGYRSNPAGSHVSGAILLSLINVPIGAFLGYLGGCLVAGVVLLLEMGSTLRARLRRGHGAADPQRRPPPEAPPIASA